MSIEAPHFNDPETAAPQRDLQQWLVPPAMLIVAAAMGTASNLHLGLSVEIAVAVGVSMFCLMLMCHVLLRMADEAERVAEEEAERGATNVPSPMPAAYMARPIEPRQHETMPHYTTMPAEPGAPEPQGPPAGIASPPALPASPPAQAEVRPDWTFRPVDLRQPGMAPAADTAFEQRESGTPPLPELGQLRPSFEAHVAEPSTRTDEPHSLPARDADRIDSILKRLARQIQAGSAARLGVAPDATPAAAMQPASAPTGDAPLPGAEAPLEVLAAANPDTALASAVDALRSTVEAMRGSNLPAQAPVSAAEMRIAEIAEAIHAERADVFLSPILGLADDQARHFEVSVKLRVAATDPDELRATAASGGLLALLDALNVRHASGFALMLERRGRDGAVFSQVGGSSLESEMFVNDLAGRHAQGIADRMVLSFAQDEIRGLGPAQLAALGDLGRLGFRFALQGLADLVMDFEALHTLGFEFVKLDAAVFLGGLTCNEAHIPPGDICQHFEDLGLAVIVGGIGDADTRERMLACGVAYGQGPLFGPPRPVAVAGAGGRTIAA